VAACSRRDGTGPRWLTTIPAGSLAKG